MIFLCIYHDEACSPLVMRPYHTHVCIRLNIVAKLQTEYVIEVNETTGRNQLYFPVLSTVNYCMYIQSHSEQSTRPFCPSVPMETPVYCILEQQNDQKLRGAFATREFTCVKQTT
jgi:hypothetical protein